MMRKADWGGGGGDGGDDEARAAAATTAPSRFLMNTRARAPTSDTMTLQLSQHHHTRSIHAIRHRLSSSALSTRAPKEEKRAETTLQASLSAHAHARAHPPIPKPIHR